MAKPDKDVAMIAEAMIWRYGTEAADYAALAAVELREVGEKVAAATWDKVVVEINAQPKRRN